jgi:hypothetical protein
MHGSLLRRLHVAPAPSGYVGVGNALRDAFYQRNQDNGFARAFEALLGALNDRDNTKMSL